jgi:hypothetical protein
VEAQTARFEFQPFVAAAGGFAGLAYAALDDGKAAYDRGYFTKVMVAMTLFLVIILFASLSGDELPHVLEKHCIHILTY